MPNFDIFPITKKELRKLYFKDKLSMFQIADQLGCTHSAIVYKFKKFGLKSRGHIGLTKPIRLTKSGFENFYYKKRLSLKKIARIVHCSESGLERRFKSYNLTSRGNKNRTCKYKKFDFSGNLTEKAYLIGFRLGDLNVTKRVSVIQVRCSTTIPAQIRLIKNLFVSYTTPYVTRAKRGTYEIVCLVNRSFDFLLPKKDKIPEWVLTNQKTFWSFFAGYTDAEGCFYLKRPRKYRGMWSSGFEIQTQQEKIIKSLWNGVLKCGIDSPYPKISRKGGSIDKRGIINNRDIWRLDINKKGSLGKFINFIELYIKHENKIKTINKVKENLKLRGV